MSREEFTPEELADLTHSLQRWRPDLLPKLETLDSSVRKDISNMIKAVGDELVEEGFLWKDQKSHEYGMRLEHLIDKLYAILKTKKKLE